MKKTAAPTKPKAPSAEAIEHLAMAICWQENTGREYIRNRARFILETLDAMKKAATT